MGNVQTRRSPHDAFQLRELTPSWSAAVDDLFFSMRARMRRLSLLSIVFLVSSALFVLVVQSPPPSPIFLWSSHRPHPSVRYATPPDDARIPVTAPSDLDLHPIKLSVHTALPHSEVRRNYARLASAYLAPFSRAGKISNASYMRPFLHENGVCGGCFLLQVKNRSMFLFDPRGVRTKMPSFRVLRLREALYWVESAVSRGVVDNMEMVFSTTDGVPTTSRNHSYRMPPPGAPSPIFASVGCNVSDNVPFPLMLSDVLRRGLPDRFWQRKSDSIDEWDAAMVNFSRMYGEFVPWKRKKHSAVFRGRIRVSSFLGRWDMFDSFCDRVGRTALWARARDYERSLRRIALARAEEIRIWPLPARWFLPNIEPVLDVKVDGTCGHRIYVTDNMPMSKQAGYKYIVHVEGNSFWADRLMLLMFGSSAILKQETPCGMFFEPLLKANVHYIPVDYWFDELVRKTQWARQNDEEVVRIVRNARRFASEYLSKAAIQTYVDEVLTQYGELLEDRRIQLFPGSVQVYP